MLDTVALTFDREHITPLDEELLAGVAGGEGPLSWIADKVGALLFDCIAGGLDDLIAAAKEGYQDGR
jgi:hypothetical protein